MLTADWIKNRVIGLCRGEQNRLDPDADEPAFDLPLVGVAAGADPLWERIAQDIGPFCWRPEQAFAHAFPETPLTARELSVVAWVLPQTKATRKDHRAQKTLPCLRWSQARHHGEAFNEHLRREVVAALAGLGIKAAAPVLLPQWRREVSERFGYASTWSERHAAFMAGLGTFGVSDGLITERGKAVRVGSVVLEAALAPTPRPYGDNHRAYCLHYAGRKCLVCARRCPAKAISAQGHDKVACKRYIREVTAPFVEARQMGVRVNSCGLCQAGVPCEAGNPMAGAGRREVVDSGS